MAKYEAENCTKHLISAGTSFVMAGVGATVGILTVETVAGGVAGGVAAAGNIVKGSADLAAYFNCKDKNAALQGK